MILAGDIGGTKTNLALATLCEGRLCIEAVRSFESQRYDSLEAVVESYLAGTRVVVERACFGVAGPVLGGKATITNLPWRISEDGLRQQLSSSEVRLINDLTALAYAVPALGPEDLAVVHAGVPEEGGAIAILAPGTGLGQGYLCWDGAGYRPGASEGGHTDFAPADELQVELWRHLRQQYGHVSWERVLSGPGLHNIYGFLHARGGAQPPWVAERLASVDPSAVISALGLAGQDALCVEALDVFISVMGAQAGNLALTLMATGGVYLGGGIPPKILPKLQDGAFAKAFRDKGRLARVLECIPVYVIRREDAPLVGAASCALGGGRAAESG